MARNELYKQFHFRAKKTLVASYSGKMHNCRPVNNGAYCSVLGDAVALL
jgi:hypothetical protein